MAVKCNACGKFLSQNLLEGVTCTRCRKCMHRACLGISKDTIVPNSWICPECKLKIPKSNSDSTPVKSHQDDGASAASVQPEPHLGHPKMPTQENAEGDGRFDVKILGELKSDLRSYIQTMCYELREDFVEAVDAMRSDFKAFQHEMRELRSAMEALDKRLGALEGRVEKLEQGGGTTENQEATGVIKELEAAVAQLKQDVYDRDQELLRNDLDFSGIPEESGENPTHLVLSCAAKLGVKMDERDIVSCSRVGPTRQNIEDGARPRPIAVQLARRAERDALLKAARVRRGTTTEGLGLRASPNPFYVNERLTKRNRMLFNRARKAKAQSSFKYVWTRDGKVFVREDQELPVHRIKSDSDLERVFGLEIVRSLD